MEYVVAPSTSSAIDIDIEPDEESTSEPAINS